jgi:hypothetical protein
MAFTKITSTNIAENTVAGYAEFANIANSLAPKITSIAITSNTYSVLDDTAVNVGGGFIVVTGTEFQSGATVLIDTTPATAVSYINNTTLRVQVPTKSAASYNIYVVNPDGGVGIKVAGLTYSTNPTWVTASPLDNQLANTAFNVTLSATGASSYSVAAGSTLPAGTTLAANGYFSGTVSIDAQTTYTFSIVATDSELQDSSKTFQVTVTIDPPDPYFNYTTLLLQADDVSNNATNSSFVDSSNNAYAITATGAPVQGSQNPFGTGNWSNYFASTHLENGNDNVGLQFGTGNFTIEAWIYPTVLSAGDRNIIEFRAGASTFAFRFGISGASTPFMAHTSGLLNGSYSFSVNQWYHIALTRQNGTATIWVNGVSAGSGTVNNDFTQGYLRIGNDQSNGYFTGYISNLRVLKGQALYTTTFTPSTTPLTAIANTQLLTCQSNSFKDSSNNALALTVFQNLAKVERFNPFGTNAIAYSSNTDTGSTYFNGSSDYLSLTKAGGLGSGNFTLEWWMYAPADSSGFIFNSRSSGIGGDGVDITTTLGVTTSSVVIFSGITLPREQWIHVAYVRSSSVITRYVNGVAVGTPISVGNDFSGTGFYIGGSIAGNVGYFKGYISNFRHTTTAVYTSAFTPPTIPLTAIENTSLLLLSKNAGIYDATEQNNIQTVGDAKVRTNIYKYGTGSIYLDGTGDYLSVLHTNGIDLSSGDFTIESWVYWNSYASNAGIIYKGPVGDSGYGSYLFYQSGQSLYFYASSNGSAWDRVSNLQIAATPSLGVWHHIAVTRSGNVYRTFFNGTLVESTTVSGNLLSDSSSLNIGRYNPSVFDGYIDDLRITKGYARYTANFTPPTAKLPSK